MRRLLVLLVCLGAAGAFAAGGGPLPPRPGVVPGPPAVPVAVLQGTVVDALTDRAVGNATVSASSGPTATTAPDGTYALSMPNGSVTLTVRAAGYHPTSVTVTVRSGGPPVNISLAPFVYAVHGAVVDRGNSVALGQAVIVANPGDVVAATNPAGSYRLTLENGSYTLTISAPGYRTSTVPIVVDGAPETLYLFLSPAASPAEPSAGAPPTILLVGVSVGAAAAAIGAVSARRRRRRTASPSDAPLAGLPSLAGPGARVGARGRLRDRDPPR